MKQLALEPLELIKFTGFHETDIIYHLPIFVEIILIVSIFFIFKKKLFKEKIWMFLLLFTALSAIMTTNLFPWEYTPSILQTLQFPWRLCAYIFFGAILLCGVSINYFEGKKYFKVACIVLILLAGISAYYYMADIGVANLDTENIDLRRGMGNEAEYLPYKTETLISKQVFFIKSGEADIYIKYNDTPNMIFDVELKEETITELPRIYYPGYTLKCDGKVIELEESENGFLQAKLEKSGTYYLSYDKTIIMKVSLVLSIATASGIVIFIVWRRTKKAS